MSEFEQEIDQTEERKMNSLQRLSDTELRNYKKRIEDNIRYIKKQLDNCHYINADGQFIRLNELYHHADIIIEVLRSRGYDYNLNLEPINCYKGGYFYVLWDNNYPFSRNIQVDIADELNNQ